MVMRGIEALDGATVERAGALVAVEQAAARRVRPELPAAFEDPCASSTAGRRASPDPTAATEHRGHAQRD
jgi:hypothetical protein